MSLPMLALLATQAFAHDDRADLHAQASLRFQPDTLAEQVSLRAVGENDAWGGAEVRYTPGHEWLGRAGAGVDVLGNGNWDLTVGLFLGGAGTWDEDAVRLQTRPQGGTDIAFAIDAKRVWFRYRWLAGWGGGNDLDQLMTENELTLGFAVVNDVYVLGELVRLNPGEERPVTATGLGMKVVF